MFVRGIEKQIEPEQSSNTDTQWCTERVSENKELFEFILYKTTVLES
jgi:hypothetical protein